MAYGFIFKLSLNTYLKDDVVSFLKSKDECMIKNVRDTVVKKGQKPS